MITEAMASGVPVIASERAGASARIEHGKNGYIVPPEVDAISGVLEKLRQPETAKSIGASAYEKFWASPPSLRAHASQLTALYEEMIR